MFTTLGLGDWITQTLDGMLAAGIESVLGFVQGGVFFAVLIDAQQDGMRGEEAYAVNAAPRNM